MVDATGLAIGELILRAACAGVLIWAGVAKLRDPDLAVAVGRLTKLRPSASAIVARLVPPLELVVGVGLVLPPATQGAAVIGIFMLGSFIFLLIGHMVTGSQESCSCFGRHDSGPISGLHVLRNVVMVLVLVPAAVRPTVIEAHLAHGLPWDVQVIATGTGAMLALLGLMASYLRTMTAPSGPEAS